MNTECVRELMAVGNCRLSAVNAAEIVANLAGNNRLEAALRQVITHIGTECIPFAAVQATEAGLLSPITRYLGLSLGDRVCLALARLSGSTADRSWLQLAEPLGLTIDCIRPPS